MTKAHQPEDMRPSPLVYCLVIAFGYASWMGVNSIWVELPLIVNVAPEGWYLPSYLSVIVQIACIGPLAYGLAEKLLKGFSRLRDGIIIGQLVLAIFGTLLMAFLYERTAPVAGNEHSVVLFATVFIVALSATTSNLTFLPSMGRFKPDYMIAYFVGMGFSGLIPSLLSLAQGSGVSQCVVNVTSNETLTVFLPPRFNFLTFSAVIAGCLTFSLVAFLLLSYFPPFHSERVDLYEKPPQEEPSKNDEGVHLSNGSEQANDAPSELGNIPYFTILFLTAWVCALMNGILPSIQSFSCLPYGQSAYHYAVALSNMANPVGCFVPFFIHNDKLSIVWGLSALATATSAYCIATAAMSPFPPLVGAVSGGVVVVLFWILSIGLCAYLRTVMAALIREHAHHRPQGLFWLGAATQLGSFLGAIVLFPMVNVYGLFKSADRC